MDVSLLAAWEECSAADGHRYFIDYNTRATALIHPRETSAMTAAASNRAAIGVGDVNDPDPAHFLRKPHHSRPRGRTLGYRWRWRLDFSPCDSTILIFILYQATS